jgi:hypothetical protein
MTDSENRTACQVNGGTPASVVIVFSRNAQVAVAALVVG